MSDAGSVLFRDVELDRARRDVLVLDGRVHRIGSQLRPEGDCEVVDAHGGELLSGLHDHHVHLAALAAARTSVQLGPPEVTTPEQFASALATAHAELPPGQWLRGVGYHESVAGPLDREVLDRLVPSRPVRVQDRSGKRWTLSSVGLRLIAADASAHPGIERDRDGRPSGVVERADDWLAQVLGGDLPDLAVVGRMLADLGVTAVTDCTPYRDAAALAGLAAAAASGQLPQRVHVTGGPELAEHRAPPPLHLGPVKVLLDEDRLPPLDQFVEWIRAAHAAGRSVAVHVVTAASLAYSLAAWGEAGAHSGDRIEHGSVITPEAAARVAALGLTVVTQPGFVAARGDRYLAEVDPDEVPHLYRCASLLELGIPVAGSTDAPYTDPDPWSAIRAAVDRRTPSGELLGGSERLPLRRAVQLFTGHPLDPGRSQRRVEVGAAADLCLLGRPLREEEPPTAADVRATYRGGVRI